MAPTLFPLAVELCITLLFCGVLFFLRKSLTPRSLAFWLLLWVGRGAASLLALQHLSGAQRFVLLIYAPLQIAFALALVAMAVRLENQKRELRVLNDELARLRRLSTDQLDIDPLTGLLNRSALARRLEEEERFTGLVVVCDMDDFKPLNDQYGHLVGDEILHGVGKLIRASIREQDLAFRWGGDEFVIFFRNEDVHLVEDRMHHLEQRLLSFHIRNHGVIPVRFSWGMAATSGRALRESLAEADGSMYAYKRNRRLAAGEPQPEAPPLSNPSAARQTL